MDERKDMRPTVVVADDHVLVAHGLAKLVENELEVVAIVDQGRDLPSVIQRHQPNVVLVDISMPEYTGVEAARQVRELAPNCKVIIVTMHSNPEYVREAFRAGASAYVLKRSAVSELMAAVHQVLAGNVYVSPFIAKDIVTILSEPPAPTLTLRQREVLRLVAEGRSAKEIAESLGISVKTAQFHKAMLMDKLNVHSTAELTKYALAHGIAS